MKPETITLAMTGASGAPYTLRLLECCLQANIHVQFITSQPGQIVVGMETDLKLVRTVGKSSIRTMLIVPAFSACSHVRWPNKTDEEV